MTAEDPAYLSAVADDNARRTAAMRADLLASAEEAEHEADGYEARARVLRDEAKRARAAAKALAP
jgi:hypothetical protein